MRDGDVPPWWAGHQRILNARAVPERFTRCEPVPVRVRLRWADDGIEVIETRATAWTTPLVLVLVEDSRSVTRGVWVPAVDVTRLRPRPTSENSGDPVIAHVATPRDLESLDAQGTPDATGVDQ